MEDFNVRIRTKYDSKKRTKKRMQNVVVGFLIIAFGVIAVNFLIAMNAGHKNAEAKTRELEDLDMVNIIATATPIAAPAIAEPTATICPPSGVVQETLIRALKKSNEYKIAETVINNLKIARDVQIEKQKEVERQKKLKEERLRKKKERLRKKKLEKARIQKLRKKNRKYVPSGFGDTCSYMKWDCITSRSSKQWKLKQEAEAYNSKGMGYVNGRFAIAIKPYYGGIGDYLDICYEDGSIMKAIVVDEKGSENEPGKGTTSEIYASSNKKQLALGVTNKVHTDGSVLEFVVDGEGKTTGWNGFRCYNGNKTVSKLYPEFDQNIKWIAKVGNYWKKNK